MQPLSFSNCFWAQGSESSVALHAHPELPAGQACSPHGLRAAAMAATWTPVLQLSLPAVTSTDLLQYCQGLWEPLSPPLWLQQISGTWWDSWAAKSTAAAAAPPAQRATAGSSLGNCCYYPAWPWPEEPIGKKQLKCSFPNKNFEQKRLGNIFHK